jgi:hypothetical protein
MATLTLYIDGSIDFTNGSAAIVGSGTTFTALLQGDPVFGPDGKWYELDLITDDTHATLNTTYKGATALASPGGVWTILKSAKGRDSVRTATKQLTDITSIYRRIINLTNSDQTLRLNKATAADRAGSIIQKAGLDLFQAGSFEDDDFSIRYLLATTWTKALGVDPTTGGFSLYSQLLFGNIITPLQFTATVNNFAPEGIAQANVLRLSSNGSRALTGIAGGVDGRVLAVMNVGSNDIDLENEGGTSTAANRFKLTGNITISPDSSVLLMYDGGSSRWRQMAGSGAGGGGDSDGDKGWSPVLAYVADGERLVAKIVDWVGGEGAKPASGSFIGATGPVDNAADAVSVLGPKGDQVEFRVDLPSKQVQWRYAGTLNWIDLVPFDAITGPTSTLEWDFSTAITDTTPGDGAIRFNSGTFGTITHLYFSKKYRQGTDASAFLNSFDDSSSLPNRGTLMLLDTLDRTKFSVFQVIDNVIDAGDYIKVPVTPTGGQIFGNTRRVSVMFLRTGDKGIPGIIPRGNFDIAHSYIVGDVVDWSGSSYISLVQPNLGHLPAFESTNTYWALFARGVNDEFVTAINLTLTQAQERAAAALASQILAARYAQTSDAYVVGLENSAKSWAIGGTGEGQPDAGDAKSWATKITGTVDGTLYSAKQYSINTKIIYDDAVALHTDMLLLESSTADSAAEAASAAITAASGATTATTQAGIATTKASEATTAATTATGKAAEAVVSATGAALSADDAEDSSTDASSQRAAAEAARDAAIGAAAAAAGYAAILANPDYGFFTETPADSRDYGSF